MASERHLPLLPAAGFVLVWSSGYIAGPYGVKAMDVLAQLGTPDGREPIDREVAAAYLRLAPEAANKEPYASLGVKPEPEPNGTQA